MWQFRKKRHAIYQWPAKLMHWKSFCFGLGRSSPGLHVPCSCRAFCNGYWSRPPEGRHYKWYLFYREGSWRSRVRPAPGCLYLIEDSVSTDTIHWWVTGKQKEYFLWPDDFFDRWWVWPEAEASYWCKKRRRPETQQTMANGCLCHYSPKHEIPATLLLY